MKKISTILVLMLIALMLFVSCNNSTPTKDNSTPAEETPKERAATEDDYTLFITLSNVILSDLENRVQEEQLPPGASISADSSTITLDSCEFDSYDIDGSSLHVKLNGTVTVKPEGEDENIVYYYTFNLTEGSTIKDTAFTAYIEFSSKGTADGANFSKITINSLKVTGFTEFVKKRITRPATPNDIEITKKLLNVFNYIGSIQDEEERNALLNSVELKYVRDSVNNKETYKFTGFKLSYLGTTYCLNGTVIVTRNPDYSYTIECDFMNNGTKLDNKNYSIMAYGIQEFVEESKIKFTFSEAMINCTNITDLQVTI